MLEITNNNIKLTRGDTAVLNLSVTDAAGDTYDYSSDLTQFTVKRNCVTEDIVLQKTFNGTSIELEPSDTNNLNYGIYRFDVKVITPEDKVYTVIEDHDFVLTNEVNFNVQYT